MALRMPVTQSSVEPGLGWLKKHYVEICRTFTENVKPSLVVGGGDVKSSNGVYDQICLEKITLADIGNRVGERETS